MKAVLFREHGGPDKLSYEEMPMPQIGPQEVLIRVEGLRLEPSRHLDQAGESCLPDTLAACFRVGCGGSG